MPSRYTRARDCFSKGEEKQQEIPKEGWSCGWVEEQMAGRSTIPLPHSLIATKEQGQLEWQIGRWEWEVTEGHSIILSIILPLEHNEGG